MSILANRMKGVAPSSQVTNLLTANFNVPSRGRKLVFGTAAQLKISGTPEGFGFGLSSGSEPVVWLRDPADSKSVVIRLASNLSSITWQRKLETTNSPGDVQNSMGLAAGDHPLIWNSDGVVSINFADGTNRQVKTLPSPWYSFNAIRALTTSNEGIINGWAVSGSGTAVIQRFNTLNGTVTWGHQIASGEGPPFNQGMGIAESPDGTKITYGVRVQGTSQDSYTIRRVNFSNGSVDWSWKYFDSAFQSWEPFVMVESNSNILIGLQQRHLVALNPSDGTIAWQKKIGTGGEGFHDLVWDSASNYYFGCLRGTSEFVVIDVLGNFVYSRQLTSLSGSLRIRGIRTDATSVYLFLVVSGGAYVVKLPKDGTGLDGVASFPDGQEITYSATTLSITTPSHTRNSTNVFVSSSITTTGTTTLNNSASTVCTLNQSGI